MSKSPSKAQVRRPAATSNLGVIAVLAGDFEAGLRHSLDAVALHRARGRQAGVAMSLSNCGWASLGLAHNARAAEFFREAVGVAGELGHAFVVRGGALGLAAVSVSEGAHERAARLLGAEARLQEEMGIEVGAFEEEVRQRAVAEARAALGEEAFASASAHGAAMTLEEIIELCRQPR